MSELTEIQEQLGHVISEVASLRGQLAGFDKRIAGALGEDETVFVVGSDSREIRSLFATASAELRMTEETLGFADKRIAEVERVDTYGPVDGECAKCVEPTENPCEHDLCGRCCGCGGEPEYIGEER